MNQDELVSSISLFFNQCLELIRTKNKDYANTDALSNFIGISQLLNIPMEQVFLQFLIVKILRLIEITKKGKAENESIGDTLKDLTNYSALFSVWLLEAQKQSKT